MTIRHIIVEGPDGSGKTGMVTRINSLGFTTHARTSDSKTGPRNDDLGMWTVNDIKSLEGLDGNDPAAFGPWVYDRHPLISEPIYAPIARGVNPQEPFNLPNWLDYHRKLMGNHALVVWCLPPPHVVVANVNRNAHEQMPGVVENITTIYSAYARLSVLWPGPQMWWDYTTDDFPRWANELRDNLRSLS